MGRKVTSGVVIGQDLWWQHNTWNVRYWWGYLRTQLLPWVTEWCTHKWAIAKRQHWFKRVFTESADLFTPEVTIPSKYYHAIYLAGTINSNQGNCALVNCKYCLLYKMMN